MNKRKKDLVQQIDNGEIKIRIDDLYKQLAVNKNKDQFIEHFSEYLEKLTRGNNDNIT